jgi:hypothetical protein
MIRDDIPAFDEPRGSLIEGDYRYLLWRRWDILGKTLMIIGLNPSTADGFKDDPTLGKCQAAAKRWNYGQLIMTNLFAFRAAKPDQMMAQSNPVGSTNDKWLMECSHESDAILAAWGNEGTWQSRDEAVMKLLDADMMCFRLTNSKQPYHPLWLRKEDQLTPFAIRGVRLI